MSGKQRAEVVTNISSVGNEPHSIWIWNAAGFRKSTGLRFSTRETAVRLAGKINAALEIEGKYLDPLKEAKDERAH